MTLMLLEKVCRGAEEGTHELQLWWTILIQETRRMEEEEEVDDDLEMEKLPLSQKNLIISSEER